MILSRLREWAARVGWLELSVSAMLAIWCVYAWTRHARLVESFTFDDAFITLRYARNLVEHGVLSFNPDDRVDGFTSPGWTALLAVGLALGADGESAMRALSWSCGLAAALLGAVLARRLGASLSGSVGVGAIGTLSTPGFVIWSVPGMEMPYASMLATALLVAYTLPLRWTRAALALACATARPECAVLVGVLVAGDVHRAMTARDDALDARGLLRALAPQLVLCGILITLFLLHWSYYGHPLPNTYYAKRATEELTLRGKRDASEFSSQGMVIVAGLVALTRLAAAQVRSHVWAHAAFLAWALATVVVYARVGGDFVGFHRYYQPLIPASFAIVVSLVLPERGKLGTAAVALAAAWLLPALGRPLLARALDDDIGEVGSVTAYAAEWRDVGHTLANRFPANTRMAVRAAGIIPWITRFRTIDTLALNNPEIAHGNEPKGEIPGHQLEATPEQIISWQPDVVVAHPFVSDQDFTGNPPGGFATPENRPYADAGYLYECVRLVSGDLYTCYWVLAAKARTASQRIVRPTP